MAGKNTAAFGLYKSRSQAESAVNELQNAGFRSDDISVLLPDQQSSEEFAHEKNTKAPGRDHNRGRCWRSHWRDSRVTSWDRRACNSQDLDLSLRLARLWVPWRGLAQAELSEASSELWSVWAYRNMRQSGMKGR